MDGYGKHKVEAWRRLLWRMQLWFNMGLPGSAAAGVAIGFMKARMEKNKEWRYQGYFPIFWQHQAQASSKKPRIDRAEYSTYFSLCGHLADSMSRYLIRRIENSPTIVFWPQTGIVTLEGGDHLDSVHWRNGQTGQTEQHKISHVFVMTGADPNTRCLDGCVALDAKGFIKTGPDLSPENLSAAGWPLTRQPYLLETSLPGIFAVGDVRGGSIKRIASAVGEGSIAISFAHKVLQE